MVEAHVFYMSQFSSSLPMRNGGQDFVIDYPHELAYHGLIPCMNGVTVL
jgi:hypothetical protein